jgi:hypothetical protein
MTAECSKISAYVIKGEMQTVTTQTASILWKSTEMACAFQLT